MKQKKVTINTKYIITPKKNRQLKEYLFGMFVHKNKIFYIYQIEDSKNTDITDLRCIDEIFKTIRLIGEY